MQAIDELLGESTKVVGADAVYLVPLAKYEALFSALVRTKSRHNIKNTAVAFMWLIDKMTEVLDAQKRAGSIEGDAPAAQAGEEAFEPLPAFSI